jgi:hypothetical protein
MNRIVCAIVAVLLLLSGCSVPEPTPTTEPEGTYTQDIFELTFSVERLSGGSASNWDFIYSHNGETITSGHQTLLSVEVFTFYSVQVTATEDGAPNNTYTASMPVALCNGGSGKTEITVTASDGTTSTFQVVCSVKCIGKC